LCAPVCFALFSVVLLGYLGTLKALATDPSGTHLIAEYAHKLGSKATSRFCVWHADAIESSTSSVPTAPLLLLASSQINHFLGMFGQHVVFLNHALWVCSVDLKQGEEGATKKHFFVPLEFVGGNEGSMGCVSWRGGVVFPKEGEVAVVRDGLEWGV
jgi:hypothetical protein